ncbi:MAG: serine hydrolase domain-containing protein [Thermomicrobiales bacterium]
MAQDEARFMPIWAFVDRLVTVEGVPGAAVAVAADGRCAFERYAGAAAPGRPAALDTLWPLASISKLYTAAAIVALVEQGALTLSAKVCTLLPEWTGDGREKITLRQLLTHTSGLIYESPAMPEMLAAKTPLAAMVDDALGQPLLFTPGADQRYSDLGYALAARMASAATGKAFPDLVRELVLEPGRLRETFMPPPEAEYGRLAYVSGAFAEGTDGAMYNSRYALDLAHPAFGTVATVRDLLRFGLLFAPDGPERTLSARGVAAMTTDQTGGDFAGEEVVPVTGVVHAWGAGFMLKGRSGTPELVSPQSFGHGGASGCILWVDPLERITIAFVSNRHFNADSTGLLLRLDRAVNVVMAALTRRPA